MGSDDDDDDSDEDADQSDKLTAKQQIGLFEDAISLDQVRSLKLSQRPEVIANLVFPDRRSVSRPSLSGGCVHRVISCGIINAFAPSFF